MHDKALLNRSLVAALPTPLAHRLQELLDEEEPRSADELSELITVLLEYVAAVALADYLNTQTNRGNRGLDNWLVNTLSSGRIGLGVWLRWTQLAVRTTTHPVMKFLDNYVQENDLDTPTSNLNWLLSFRNEVMHGGFVAPVPKIRTAKARLEQLITCLHPLWDFQPIGYIGDNWCQLTGLSPKECSVPKSLVEQSREKGMVLLRHDTTGEQLRLDPLCRLDEQGLTLQDNWREQHKPLFLRTRLSEFFERYQRERQGLIDPGHWHMQCDQNLPTQGYRARHTVLKQLDRLVHEPGVQLRLVGPPGSGRSTLLSRLSDHLNRKVFILPVSTNSVSCDPEVVRRWLAQTLSHELLGDMAPKEAIQNATKPKDLAAREDWYQKLVDAAGTRTQRPILAIDDADLIGSGIYANQSRNGCLNLARRLGISIIITHKPSGQPPVRGDGMIVLHCWTKDELQSWSENATELEAQTGGYTDWLAKPDDAPKRLANRLKIELSEPLSLPIFKVLTAGPATALEIADQLENKVRNVFTPQIELLLRKHLDWLETTVIKFNDDEVIQYRIHPAAKRVLDRIS